MTMARCIVSSHLSSPLLPSFNHAFFFVLKCCEVKWQRKKGELKKKKKQWECIGDAPVERRTLPPMEVCVGKKEIIDVLLLSPSYLLRRSKNSSMKQKTRERR